MVVAHYPELLLILFKGTCVCSYLLYCYLLRIKEVSFVFQHNHEDSMPSYFRFLTLMAFDVFIEEQVGFVFKSNRSFLFIFLFQG